MSGIEVQVKTLFLPVGLSAALVLAFLLPAAGAVFKQAGLVPYLVVTIFIINGWQTKLRKLDFSPAFYRGLIATFLISLILGPVAGVMVAGFLDLSFYLGLGLIIMSSMPVTLSSAIVITGIAGGDVLWALFYTIFLNLIGILVIPFSLKLAITAAGDVRVEVLPLLIKLVLIVLLPFIAGLAFRRLRGQGPKQNWISYIPSFCVIMTVYITMSAWISGGGGSDLPPLMMLLRTAAACLLVHLGLLVTAWFTGRMTALGRQGRLALAFVSSQKTLPIAVSVIAVLKLRSALPLVVCLVFHFIQLFTDSIIAARAAASR